jgi:hypothetical protein
MATPDNAPGSAAPRARGWRAPAINAVAEYAERTAPIAGAGVRVSDTGAGRAVSIDPDSGVLPRPAPWEVRAKPYGGGYYALMVRMGLAVSRGAPLEPAYSAAPDGVEAVYFLTWEDETGESEGGSPYGQLYGIYPPSSASLEYLVAYAAQDGAHYGIGWAATPCGDGWTALARVPGWTDGAAPLRIEQIAGGALELAPPRPDSFPAQLSALSSGALVGYPASFYEDGVDAAATGTGMLYVPECCAVAELSAVSDLRGAWVVAHRWPVSSLGGSEASP